MRIIGGKAKGTKLYTLEGINTRPTLDRVKESIFNIIQSDIQDSVVLDLFSGSGAIGLEFLSRGAKKAILCDKSKQAAEIIKKNIAKTHFEEQVKIYNLDFRECIKNLTEEFDIIYIDPPYESNYIADSLKIIIEQKILKKDGLLIIETDDEERVLKQIEKLDVDITDKRKYGRARVLFLSIRA